MALTEFRKVARIEPDGTRTEIRFSELRKGDRFTLDDEGIGAEDGFTVHVAACDAYPCERAVQENGEVLLVPGNYAIQTV